MEANGKFNAHIRSVYHSLTKAERKVADIVLEEKHDIIYGTLTDLAEKVGVGETTVLRFCRRTGYKGFQEFKLAIAQENGSHNGNENENDEKPIRSITTKNIRLLEDTVSLLDGKDFIEMAHLFLRANKINFFGVGSSGATAENARYRFIRLGLPVEAISDGHLAPIRATLLNKEDVAVVISVSGSTMDMVEVSRLAKERGATVVCITSHARSPATKYADTVLLSSSRERPTEGSALSSIISQLHILDILFDSIYKEMGEDGELVMQRTAHATSKKLY